MLTGHDPHKPAARTDTICEENGASIDRQLYQI